MQLTHALLVGFADFGAAPTGEWDPSRPAAAYPGLPSVREEMGRLERALGRLPGVLLPPGGLLIDQGRRPVEAAWRRSLNGAAAARSPLVVHLAGHGVPGGTAATLYVPVRDTDPRRLPETALAVHQWLDEVENTEAAPYTLVLLDVCGAGRAVVHQLVQQVSVHRRAWVIAACAEDERSYGARFTRATATVLDRLREGWLDVSPFLPHVPVETLAEEIHRELLRLAPPDGDGFTQTVLRTARTQAVAEIPPFFANPNHSGDPAALLNRQVEHALWQIAAETDRGLDPVHFFSRASGGQPVSGCLFTGREAELARIVGWLDDAGGDAPPLLVLGGGPGAGKSALLGVTVCLAHPELSRSAVSTPVHNRIRVARRPQPQPRLAAVHARGLSARQVLASVAAQLGLGAEPVWGWTAAALVERLGRAAVVVVDALDEAEQPERVVAEVLLPLVAAAPLCRVAVAVRPDGFDALLATAAREGVLVDLDQVPTARLEQELTDYLEELLWHAPGYRARQDLRRAVCVGLAARLARSRESGGFLTAGLMAAHLCSLEQPLTPKEVEAALPTDLAGMLDLHLGPAERDQPWLRPVLSAVAHGFGEGMPFDVIRTLAPVFAPEGTATGPDQKEVRAALNAAAFYLRGGTDTDGRRLYRFFHQRLAEQLRQAAAGAEAVVHQRLRTVFAADGWELAPPYLLRHAADHATAGGQRDGALDALITDPGYLVHAGPGALAGHLHHASSPQARACAAVLRTSADRRPAGPETTRAVLAVDAARWGRTDLLRALGDEPVNGALPVALPRWATNGMTDAALRQTMAGHEGRVTASATAVLDGVRSALTADLSGTVRVWDPADGRLVRALVGHQGAVRALAVVAVAGRPQVVSAGSDGTVRCWDLGDGRMRVVHRGRGGVTALCVGTLADGTAVALVADRDGAVGVRDLASGRLVRALVGHQGAVRALAVVAVAGRPQVVSAGSDGTVRCWDLDDGRTRAVCRGSGRMTALAVGVLADGTAVAAAACQDGAVRAWELPGGAPRFRLPGAVGPDTVLTTLRVDGETQVAVCDDEGRIRLLSLADGRPGAVLSGHEGPVTALTVPESDDGSRLVSAGEDGTVRLWTLPEGALAATHRCHEGAVTSLAAWTGEGATQVLTAGADGVARAWSLPAGARAGDPAAPPLPGHRATVVAAAVCDLDGRAHAVTADADGLLHLRDLSDGTLRRTLAGPGGDQPAALRVTTVHGRPHAVVLGAGGGGRLWDLTDGRPGATLAGSREPVLCTVAVDGWPCALTAGPGGIVRLWDLSDGTLRRTLNRHRAPVTAAATTLIDGRSHAVTADRDGRAVVWDLGAPNDGALRHVLGAPGGAGPVALAAAGRWAVLAGGSGEARVWDLGSGSPRHRLAGHDGPVTAVALVHTAGTPHAVTGGRDGVVRLWRLTDAPDRVVLGVLDAPVTALHTLDAEGDAPARVAAVGADGDVRLLRLAAAEPAVDGLLAFPLALGPLVLCPEGVLAGFGPEVAFLAWRDHPEGSGS
ncbi:WD40 repeat protein [Streptacidiphilus sp. MAP12-33]|uniref:hypothetical protein n=1 Tax=Streptacidiphilus sp. MAP12-33 TaxID=3156266 RepID=UPI0035123FDE